MDLTKHIKQLSDDLREYLKLEVEHAKYEAIEEGSKIIGTIFSFVLILVFGCISASIIGIFAGLYLSKIFGSLLLGFAVTALVYLLIFILILVFRKAFLEKPFVSIAVKHILKHLREKQEHKE